MAVEAMSNNRPVVVLYPQPAKDYLYIKPVQNQPVSYALINLAGETLLAGKAFQKIELNHVHSGLYSLQLQLSSSAVFYQKIMVE